MVTYKATGTETSGGLTVADVRAPKGADSPRHRHQHEDEAWYVVSGELLLTPAGFEDFTRTCGWPASARTMPPAELPVRPVAALEEAARRHGIDLVGDTESLTQSKGVTP